MLIETDVTIREIRRVDGTEHMETTMTVTLDGYFEQDELVVYLTRPKAEALLKSKRRHGRLTLTFDLPEEEDE